jgi:hypothetical protein
MRVQAILNLMPYSLRWADSRLDLGRSPRRYKTFAPSLVDLTAGVRLGHHPNLKITSNETRLAEYQNARLHFPIWCRFEFTGHRERELAYHQYVCCGKPERSDQSSRQRLEHEAGARRVCPSGIRNTLCGGNGGRRLSLQPPSSNIAYVGLLRERTNAPCERQRAALMASE